MGATGCGVRPPADESTLQDSRLVRRRTNEDEAKDVQCVGCYKSADGWKEVQVRRIGGEFWALKAASQSGFALFGSGRVESSFVHAARVRVRGVVC